MTWLERQFGQKTSQRHEQERRSAEIVEEMSPGLEGDYDTELREKAGMHVPPPPPEFMGLEGEYDERGLAKRVASAFDRIPELSELDTIEVMQDGGTIILQGSVRDEATLEQMTNIASRVDGTKAIDSSQVTIKAS